MRKQMAGLRGFLSAAVAGVVGLGLASAAHAASSPVTFAQFHEAVAGGGNANLIAYTDGSTSSGLSATSVPVTFSYESITGLPAAMQGPQAATLSLTSSTGSPVLLLAPYAFQSFNEFAGDTLTITRDTPFNGFSNLLTMSFTGELIGGLSGGSASLTGQTSAPVGDQITYSSDFLDFGTPGAMDYTLGFTSWTSSDGNGIEVDNSTGFLSSATAAMTGTFDVATVPGIGNHLPEPSAGVLGFFGLCGLLAMRRRRQTA
jgi:MYXO-CTERM domain-containing protein